MRFSLIMCSLGRCDEIGAFLDSLVLQNRSDLEMIIVDQNRDDRLKDLLARYIGKFPLKHVRMNGMGLSKGRNVGLAHASGELLGFPDDDCEYLAGFLERIDALFTSHPEIDGVTGHPTADRELKLSDDWGATTQKLTPVTVLDRCQEFTIFVRRNVLGTVRFNEFLGVGAGTPWGADEGPDFLISFMNGGGQLVFYPKLFVYHPNKLAAVAASTISRASSYARGRGCFLRIHHFPLKIIARSVSRPFGGVFVYLLLRQPKRSHYYWAVVRGLLRGLLISRAELTRITGQPTRETEAADMEGALRASA